VIIRLAVQDDKIVDSTFRCNGCSYAHLVVGGLAKLVKGRTFEQASLIEPKDLLLLVGGVPEGKEYYAAMAVEALREALAPLQPPITDHRSPITYSDPAIYHLPFTIYQSGEAQ
jgi:NifU-like protein involved in Fe-S cluster formation